MALQKKNVIVGAARLWLAAPDAARPTFTSATSGITTMNGAAGWTEAGYTQEGLELSYEPEYTDVEVDQIGDAVRTFQSSLRVNLNTTFAEASLTNLMIAWGQAATSLTSSGTTTELIIEGVLLGAAPEERQVLAIGNGTEEVAGKWNERIYHAYRATSVEQVSTALRKTEAQTIPVSFRLLPVDDDVEVPGVPDARGYGKITERLRNW